MVARVNAVDLTSTVREASLMPLLKSRCNDLPIDYLDKRVNISGAIEVMIDQVGVLKYVRHDKERLFALFHLTKTEEEITLALPACLSPCQHRRCTMHPALPFDSRLRWTPDPAELLCDCCL